MTESSTIRAHRAGWSYIQVIACIVALSTGVWLGAHYVGVEVEDLAYTALDKSEVLGKIPTEWRPEAPPGVALDPEKERQMAEQQSKALQSELQKLRQGVAELQTTSTVSNASANSSNNAEGDAAKTLDYWNQLNEISQTVARLNADAEAAINHVNASRVLQLRSSACQYGISAIEALPEKHVDPLVLELGATIATWYGHAAELNEKTIAIWQGGQQGISGADGAGMAAARQQFEKESGLIRTKSVDLRERLKRRHATEFPPLGL
jgi:hypothetical protein